MMRAPPGLVAPPGGEAAGTQPGAGSRGIPRQKGSALLAEIPASAGISIKSASGQFDLNINTRREVELHQRVDRLRRRLHDVEQPLVGANLELLARLLVDVRRAVHGELLDTRRQRNGTANERARAPGGVGDVTGRLVEHPMIERLQANADILRFHSNHRCERASFAEASEAKTPFRRSEGQAAGRNQMVPDRPKTTLKSEPPESETRAAATLYYFVISPTTPAPTVRPPSRIAKRRPWSMAIGAISLTPSVTLSPGITISVPSGSTTSPVTSVVRK